MKGKLSLLSAIALAGGIGLAAAQSNPPLRSAPPAASSDQNKCFDRVSGQIKDRIAMGDSGPGNKSDNAGMSSTPPGAAPNNSATTGSGSSLTVNRPAAAAGLPDC